MSSAVNPYQSPASGSTDQPAEHTIPAGKKWVPINDFRSPATLGTIVGALLLISAATEFVTGGLAWLTLQGADLFSNIEANNPAEFSPFDAGVIIYSLSAALLWITTAVLFLTWFRRCHTNLPALGATRLRMTHGWSVGWFFVPLANLWMPYRAAREIWRGSLPGHIYSGEDPRGQTPVLLQFWWVFWVLSQFLNQASFRISLRSENEPAVQRMIGGLDLGLAAWDFVLALLAWTIVRRVTAMQQEKALALRVDGLPR